MGEARKVNVSRKPWGLSSYSQGTRAGRLGKMNIKDER